MSIEVEERRRRARTDPEGVVAGVLTAITVHALVLTMMGTAGGATGNIARPTDTRTAQQRQDEEIIEGALLRLGGGGEVDPRNELHRVAPIRAEERTAPPQGTQPDPNRAQRPALPPRRDPSALQSDRDVLGQGNQDLAERLRRLAANEATADPNAPVGAGSPDGSINGTEADPARAGTGAHAKIRSFLQRQLHLLATAGSAGRRQFRLRIVLSADGESLASGDVLEGSGDETVDSDLRAQLAHLAQEHTAIPELTEDERAAIAGHSYRVVYVPNQ